MAAGALDSRGIWQFGEDDNQGTQSATLNLGMASVSTQLGVDRGRITTAETDILARVPLTKVGSVRIVPTLAGTGGTSAVDPTTGEVTFSGAVTALRVNSTTTILSAFRYIELIRRYNGTTAGSDTMQLCSGSTINTATEYRLTGTSNGTNATPAAASSWSQGYVGSRRNRRRVIKLFNLADAVATTFTSGEGFDTDPAASLIEVRSGGEHNVATAFDGIVLNLSGLGTISNGSLQLIGHY